MLSLFFNFLLIGSTNAGPNNSSKTDKKFPYDFLFGAGSAAYQIEGGWNAHDKGQSIWDILAHRQPWEIIDTSNGDVAANSYHNYKRDVEMMREVGLQVYRFSISWARILPDGLSTNISAAGIEYYNKVINEMLKYNIVPMITLYHWDLPQKLQELGGFANAIVADWFEDYARVVFSKFADRVRYWITFSDPKEICSGYGGTEKAPQISSEIGEYICAKNLLLAHAKAYYLYNDYYKPKYDGVVGISIAVNWFAPESSSNADELVTRLLTQSSWGMYTDPIFSKKGGFPKELSELIAENSKKQGYSRSRLPEFTDDERVLVQGSSDFFGLNHYTSAFVNAALEPISNADVQCEFTVPPEWPQAATHWLRLAPNSLLNTLISLRSKYDNLIFYITENGWSTTPTAGLDDDDRIRYIRAMLEDVLSAIDAGIKVQGYILWSLMDGWEWTKGYTERFGLYEVDFSDPIRRRMPRKSAAIYKDIIKTRKINYNLKPASLTITIDRDEEMQPFVNRYLAPNSLLNTLISLRSKYDNLIFYITENGWSTTPTAGLDDDDRIRYIRAMLEDVLSAIDAGIKVQGYILWSLMDGWEWTKGYTERFGLYEVDFSDPIRRRMPRKSAAIYKDIIKTRKINYNLKPASLTITIDRDEEMQPFVNRYVVKEMFLRI